MLPTSLHNSLSGVALIMVNAVLQVVTIPLLLSSLGAEGYGIFALLSTIGLFGYFINIGFNMSVLKFVGEQGVGRESDRDILLSFSAVTVLTIAASTVIVLLNQEVLTVILGLAPEHVDAGVVRLMNAIVLTNALLFIGQVLTAVLDVQKRIFVTNYLQILYVTANRLTIIAVLVAGGRFQEMANVYIATSIGWFLLLVAAFLRYWRFTDVHRWYEGGMSRLKKHFEYGIKIYMTSIAGFFYEPFAKILISRYIGLSEVGVFDIAFRVKTLFWGIIEKGLYPIVPRIVTVSASEARAMIDWLSRKLLLIAIPVSVLLYFIIEPAIRLWLGPDQSMTVFAVRVLIVVHMLNASMIPIYAYLLMKDHAGKAMAVQFLNAVFGMVYFFPLSAAYGFAGSVVAFAGAVMTTQFILLWWQWTLVQSNAFGSVRDIGKAVAVAAVAAAGALAVSMIHLGTIAELVLTAFIGTIVIGGLLYRWSLFTMRDVRIVTGRESFTLSPA